MGAVGSDSPVAGRERVPGEGLEFGAEGADVERVFARVGLVEDVEGRELLSECLEKVDDLRPVVPPVEVFETEVFEVRDVRELEVEGRQVGELLGRGLQLQSGEGLEIDPLGDLRERPAVQVDGEDTQTDVLEGVGDPADGMTLKFDRVRRQSLELREGGCREQESPEDRVPA